MTPTGYIWCWKGRVSCGECNILYWGREIGRAEDSALCKLIGKPLKIQVIIRYFPVYCLLIRLLWVLMNNSNIYTPGRSTGRWRLSCRVQGEDAGEEIQLKITMKLTDIYTTVRESVVVRFSFLICVVNSWMAHWGSVGGGTFMSFTVMR